MNLEYKSLDLSETGCTTDISAFVNCVRACLDGRERVEVILRMDTDYSYRLQWCNDHYLHIQELITDWEVIIPKYMSPCFLKKCISDISDWEAALVCDLANRICMTNHQSFFDWELCVPVALISESEVECTE